MIRQPEREQLKRLTVKTLDQVFVMRAKEGLGCSRFEAQALTDLFRTAFPLIFGPKQSVGANTAQARYFFRILV